MNDRLGRNRILFVCTANICRSPSAELLARTLFGEEQHVFRSTGFLGGGHEMPDELVTVLGERGIDATHHRSYTIDDPSIEAADLLLTMESAHLQRATAMNSAAFAKIVPLKEAAEVIGTLPADQGTVADLVAAVNVTRDPRSYLDGRWDVADPYGQRMKAYRRAVDEIEGLVRSVIGRLR